MKKVIVKRKVERLAFVIQLVLAVVLFFIDPRFGLLLLGLLLVVYAFLWRAGIFFLIASNIYQGGKNLDAAVLWMKKAYDTRKLKYQKVIAYAYLLMKKGDFKSAGEILDTVISGNYNNEPVPAVYRQLARNYKSIIAYNEGDLPEAVAISEKLLSEGFKNSILYANLGFYYLESNDNKKALEFCEDAYQFNKDDNTIKDNLAMACLATGDKERARRLWSEITGNYIYFPEPFYNYAGLLLEQGEKENALEMIDKAQACPFSALTTISIDDVKNRKARIQKLPE